jgi:subtilisin family serine protease
VAIWSTLPVQPGEFGFLERSPGERRAAPRPLARNTRYDAWPGTSGACPHVTAAVALLLASRGKLPPAEIKRRLMRSADRVAGMKGRRFDPSYGAGRLNLRRLLEQSP